MAGLVQVLQPKLVLDLGTAAGGSALAMKTTLPQDAKIVSFDIVDWRDAPERVLEGTDFSDGRLVQHVADLSDRSVLDQHRALFEQADLMFIDLAKDGAMEQRLIDHFEMLTFQRNPLLVFDDVRLWNMLKIWRDIRRPKLDLTSFGHWTGTGLVDWKVT